MATSKAYMHMRGFQQGLMSLEQFPFDIFLVSCYIPKTVEGGGAPPLPSKIAPRLGEQHETWL